MYKRPFRPILLIFCLKKLHHHHPALYLSYPSEKPRMALVGSRNRNFSRSAWGTLRRVGLSNARLWPPRAPPFLLRGGFAPQPRGIASSDSFTQSDAKNVFSSIHGWPFIWVIYFGWVSILAIFRRFAADITSHFGLKRGKDLTGFNPKNLQI